MSYARFSTHDVNGKIRGYVGEGAFTDDPLETFGGAGVVRDSALAAPAALHLRARLRASRGGQSLARPPERCMRPLRITWVGRCTGIGSGLNDGDCCWR